MSVDHPVRHRTLGSTFRAGLGGMAVLLVGVLLGVGCSSPGSTAFRAVATLVVASGSVDDVGIASLETFQKAGYESREVQRGSLVFERHGSTMDKVIYGGLIGNDVWERVRVRIAPVTASTCRIECDAFKVRNPGDQVFEEQHRIRSGDRYAKLLDQVGARFK